MDLVVPGSQGPPELASLGVSVRGAQVRGQGVQVGRGGVDVGQGVERAQGFLDLPGGRDVAVGVAGGEQSAQLGPPLPTCWRSSPRSASRGWGERGPAQRSRAGAGRFHDQAAADFRVRAVLLPDGPRAGGCQPGAPRPGDATG